MTINFLGMVFIFSMGFFLGIIVGLHGNVREARKQERLFENCLEWKKDFDWCRKEFMS
jgi:hypothetical protein